MSDSGAMPKELVRRMEALGLREEDLEETFIRSGGHGGQNVNKSATCVMLVHRPSGVQVKCQVTRQQGANRVLARRILADRIEKLRGERLAEERSRLAKLRRATRGRSRGAKERILADKARTAFRKLMRRKVAVE